MRGFVLYLNHGGLTRTRNVTSNHHYIHPCLPRAEMEVAGEGEVDNAGAVVEKQGGFCVGGGDQNALTSDHTRQQQKI